MELYIHIPFCVKKCSYCDFLSAPADEQVRESYVQRLCEEIKCYGPVYKDRVVETIFFGGGTPSILEGVQIARIMQQIRDQFQVAPNAEITIECNPGTVTEEKCASYVKAGINRVSIGLQSANNLELAMLGRIHRFGDFLESYEMLRKAGIRNINVDLMSALPGQTVDSWRQTLERMAALHPEHISAYSLIIEEGTPFYELYGADEERRKKGEQPRLLPTEEAEREMYELTEQFLSKRGYTRYEISNYARKGMECRHNIGYWTGAEYLGLGLGASSYMDHVRFSNTTSLEEYLTKHFHHCNPVCIERKEAMEEYMFLGLRMMRGIKRSEFQEKFETPIEAVYGDVLKTLQKDGLIQSREGTIYLTKEGINVSNMVLSQFLL